METKQQIRASCLAARKEMPLNLRKQYSEQICENLEDYFTERRKELKRRGVYGYYPLGTEVSLIRLYLWLLEEEIPLAFPRVSGETMEFYRVDSMREFEKGAFGIYEPMDSCSRAGLNEAICFVPGSVFDWTGNRYGYGKGYYDRYFLRCPDLYRMGIAYEMQVKERISAEAHDVKMQALATETGVYRKKKYEKMERTGRMYDGIIRNL